MSTLPAWLPAPVAAHALRLLDSGGLDDAAHTRLIRLVTDAGMRKVWTTLARAAPDQTAFIEFLDHVRLHRAATGPLLPAPGMTHTQQRKAFTRIATLADSLLAELAQLAPYASEAESGLSLLEHAARRAGVEALATQTVSGPVSGLGLPALPDPDMESVSAVEVLRALAHTAALAAAAPPSGPRKQHAQHALRTAYIQDIAHFVERRFGKPYSTAVAQTISVSLEDPNITEDLVRKLCMPKRKISRSTRK